MLYGILLKSYSFRITPQLPHSCHTVTPQFIFLVLRLNKKAVKVSLCSYVQESKSIYVPHHMTFLTKISFIFLSKFFNAYFIAINAQR